MTPEDEGEGTSRTGTTIIWGRSPGLYERLTEQYRQDSAIAQRRGEEISFHDWLLRLFEQFAELRESLSESGQTDSSQAH